MLILLVKNMLLIMALRPLSSNLIGQSINEGQG